MNDIKNILIFGLSITGIGVLKSIYDKKEFKHIYLYDDNSKILHESLSKFNLCKRYKSIDLIEIVVISPGIKPNNKLLIKFVEQKIPILSDIDLFYLIYNRYFSNRIYSIGITGTNGKSSTVEYVFQLFKKLNITSYKVGNIGISPFSIADKILNKKEIIVLIFELSSFQLSYTNYYRFNHASILNISSDHLDYHMNYEEYIISKVKLSTLTKSISIRAEMEFFLRKYNLLHIKRNIIYRGKYIKDINVNFLIKITDLYAKVIVDNEEINIDLNHYKEIDQYNILIAVLIILETLKYFNKDFIAFIKNLNIDFLSIPQIHKGNKILLKDGIYCINNSKATNLHATYSFIKDHKRKFSLILGGYLKDSINIDILESIIKVDNLKSIILYGRDRYLLYKYIYQFNVSIYLINEDESINMLFHNIILYSYLISNCDEDIIFAPGSSSYDTFKNYIERGLLFTKTIEGFKI